MSWRRWALLLLAAAVFVALRLTFNREYEGAPWEALVDGTAKLPFGHRVLVPWLVRPAVRVGVSIAAAFAVTEGLAVIAALTGVEAALRCFVSRRDALLGAAAFVPVLCMIFLLPFRWPIFYPWDTPAIACVAWGVALAHGRRHGPLVVLATLGAANRESAILLPLVTVLLHLRGPDRWEAVRSAMLQVAGVVLMRLAIGALHPVSKGSSVDLRVEGMWRLDHNVQWLSDPRHSLAILGASCMLPVLWVAVRPWIPAALRRLELLVIAVMAGLFVVANVYEPRAWGEPVTVLFLGTAVGVAGWSRGASPQTGLGLVERWAAPAFGAALGLALLAWRLA